MRLIQTFDKKNHGLLLGMFSRKFRRPMIFLDGFLFDRSYTMRSGWRLFVVNDLLSFWCTSG
jgi:hypothetical protein